MTKCYHLTAQIKAIKCDHKCTYTAVSSYGTRVLYVCSVLPITINSIPHTGCAIIGTIYNPLAYCAINNAASELQRLQAQAQIIN